MVVLAGCECDGWLVALCALLLGSSLANKKASRPSLMESWLRMEDQWWFQSKRRSITILLYIPSSRSHYWIRRSQRQIEMQHLHSTLPKPWVNLVKWLVVREGFALTSLWFFFYRQIRYSTSGPSIKILSYGQFPIEPFLSTTIHSHHFSD